MTKNNGGSQKSKSKAQVEREKVLALLDAADQEVPQNPGLFSKDPRGADNFAELFEKSLEEKDFKVGDIVQGRVCEVQDDYVLVDIKYKSEGLIPISEFRVVDGARDIAVGSVVEVYIDRIENENGMVVLSKDKADMMRAWNDISRAAENEEIIEGVVIAKVKGGLSVDIGTGQPTTKARMGMVPPHNHFGSARLFEHVQHFRLKDRIYGFYTHGGSRLRHRKDVNTINCVIIDELTQHETHDFHGNSCSAML